MCRKESLLLLVPSVLVSYYVIRTAVHHGVRDADRDRAEAAARHERS